MMKMEDAERMVLRRRKQYLSEVVQLSDELLLDMESLGLVTSEMINLIQLDRTNQTRVLRLVECILAHKPADAFGTFCLALGKIYPSISRDLANDLKVERGEVNPLPEIVEEAAVLVHRKFGTSKRFSEGDKKEMAEMIAIKLQVVHDEWKSEIGKLQDQLEHTRSELLERDELARYITNMQRDFVRRHETQLVTHAHDMTTTREFIKRMLEDRGGNDVLFQLKENMEKFIKQTTIVLNHRDSLYYEKEKCLRMLGIKDNKVALDEVISKATGLTTNANMEIEDKSDIIKRLRRQVEDMEKEIETYEEEIGSFRQQVNERDREISKLRHMVQI